MRLSIVKTIEWKIPGGFGRRAFLTIVAFAAIAGLVYCRKSDGAPVGQSLYRTHCISCHNLDPAKDGVLGPALKGSSLELVRARVLEASYPTGYTPKRATRTMQKIPLPDADVAAIADYLK